MMRIPFSISMLLCIVHLLTAPAPRLSSASESKNDGLSSSLAETVSPNSSLALTKNIGLRVFHSQKKNVLEVKTVSFQPFLPNILCLSPPIHTLG